MYHPRAMPFGRIFQHIRSVLVHKGETIRLVNLLNLGFKNGENWKNFKFEVDQRAIYSSVIVVLKLTASLFIYESDDFIFIKFWKKLKNAF